MIPAPSFVLRSHHSSPITHLSFHSRNPNLLVSSDEDGWVVVWNLKTFRAEAIFKAHGEGSLLSESEVIGGEEIVGQAGEGGVIWAGFASDGRIIR
jgi:WD40 repeat protein